MQFAKNAYKQASLFYSQLRQLPFAATLIAAVSLFPEATNNETVNPRDYFTTSQRIAELVTLFGGNACTIIEHTREQIGDSQCDRHRRIVFDTFKNANGKDCYQVSVADYTDNQSYIWKSSLPDTKAPDAIKVFTNCDMQANQLPANVIYTFSREFHAGGACSISSANSDSSFLQELATNRENPKAALTQFLEKLKGNCPS